MLLFGGRRKAFLMQGLAWVKSPELMMVLGIVAIMMCDVIGEWVCGDISLEIRLKDI